MKYARVDSAIHLRWLRWKTTLTRLWLWISVVLTIISSISIIEDLRLWRDLVFLALNYLYDAFPNMATIAAFLGELASVVVEYFRLIFHKPLSYMFSFFDIRLQKNFLDLVLIICLYVTGYGRSWIFLTAGSRAARARTREFLKVKGFTKKEIRSLSEFPKLNRMEKFNAADKSSFEKYRNRLKSYHVDMEELDRTAFGYNFSDEEQAKHARQYEIGIILHDITTVFIFFLLVFWFLDKLYLRLFS